MTRRAPREHVDPCPRHAAALARLDHDDAVDVALDCEDCDVTLAPTNGDHA